MREVTLRVAGLLRAAGAQRLAVMDIAAAQQAFDRIGRISRIDMRLRPGVDAERVARRGCSGELPPGLPWSARRATCSATPACRARTA